MKQTNFFPEHLALALQASNEGIYNWDITSGEVTASERLCEFLGIPVSVRVSNFFTEPEKILHKEDIGFFLTELQRYLAGRTDQAFKVDVRVKRGDFGWRWLRIRGMAAYDNDGAPTYLAGTMIDVTRRKTIEALAAEERHLFRLLIEHLPDNIYFKNRQSRFVFANTATSQKLNSPTPSDLIGRTDFDFFDQEHASRSREDELAIMETSQPILSKLERETWPGKDDTWCLSTKAPWHGKDGTLRGVFGVSSDVTRLVKTQLALRESMDELATRNRALEQEIRLAREIQLSLLPPGLPTVCLKTPDSSRFLRMHYRYQPSGGVAGDWLEAFPIDEQHTAMVVFDVMGHGVRSALIASMLRGIMEDMVRECPAPSEFMKGINHSLASILARAGITMFATAIYAYFDLEEKTVRLTSAGHPRPVLQYGEDPAQDLEVPRGPALGLFDQSQYEEIEIKLVPGLRLTAFTDGITEASDDAGQEFGRKRLKSCLDACEVGCGDEGVDWVLKNVANFTKKTQFEDDICLVIAEYSEEPAALPFHVAR